MKISEVIAVLQQTLEESGDLDVFVTEPGATYEVDSKEKICVVSILGKKQLWIGP